MFSLTQICKSVDIKDLNNYLCTKHHHEVIRHLGIFFVTCCGGYKMWYDLRI